MSIPLETTQNPGSISRTCTWSERLWDRTFRSFTQLVSLSLTLLVFGILGSIVYRAIPAIERNGTTILTGKVWDPNQDLYGIRAPIWGTIYTSFIALAIASIFGVSAAIFLSERFLSSTLTKLLDRLGLGHNRFFSPWPDRLEYGLKTMIELLAAIPSVVYGLWGIFVVIPNLRSFFGWLQRTIPGWTFELTGPSVLPASIVLAIMVLPTVTAIARDALLLVPSKVRDASYGMGATRWQAMFTVILPMSSPGIFGGILLGFGRALGETMALAMLVGNANVLSWSLLSPANTLAALLANNFPEANTVEIGILMYAALALFVITFVVNLMGQLILKWTQSAAGRN